MTQTPVSSQLRSRLVLLLIAAAFLGSFGIAAWLRFSGWLPTGARNIGQMLSPPLAISDLPLARADGAAFSWAPERHRWRLLVAPGSDCGPDCAILYDRLHRLWLSEGQKADRLEVLWVGTPPSGALAFSGLTTLRPEPRLAARLPDQAHGAAVPAYLVDPDGFVVLHYRAGFDVADVRKDLSRVLK